MNDLPHSRCGVARPTSRWRGLAAVVAVMPLLTAPAAAGLPETVAAVKPSVVGIGTYSAGTGQRHALRGTGFVVTGNHVITNAHVLPPNLDEARRETLAVFIPKGQNEAQVRPATLVRQVPAHDLALLRVGGPPLPALRLGTSSEVREGASVAFTGFPILGALGLFPATHRGLVSAVAPVVIPAGSGQDLTRDVVKRLRKPFDILQLDITAFPGNSGSPLYDPESGRVLGVINSVFIKGTKETALSDPSGITYAVPVDLVRDLLQEAGVKP